MPISLTESKKSSLDSFLIKRKYHRIKLRRLLTNHFVVEVYVNNVLGNFIIDTGASNTCVNSNVISHFGLTPEDIDITATGAGSSDIFTRICRNNHLQIGDWKAKKMEMIILDFSYINEALDDKECDPVHGIIGADTLKKGQAIIDYSQENMYIK